MKSRIKRTAAVLVWAAFIIGIASCKKEETIKIPEVKVYEDSLTFSYTNAIVIANVTDDGGAKVTSRGVYYSRMGATTSDTVFCGEGAGSFKAVLTNLQPNTSYVCVAFARNAGGMGESAKVSFTTKEYSSPTVETSEVTEVGMTSAMGGGNVTADGGAAVTARGVCWSTSENPTVSGSHTTDGTGTGSFTSNITDLSPNTTYYVRAYATNSTGTSYGSQKSFTTAQNITAPAVTTSEVTGITQTTATCGGNVTADGGAAVTARGVCWSTSENPMLYDNSYAWGGSGTGSFTVSMTGLTPNTTYYVRAYATNSEGTSYGDQKMFTTLTPPSAPTGAINGLFSVSPTQLVWFSQGNLQYIGSAATPYWKFADNQWDRLGYNGQNSNAQNADRDLFGWGTSGYNHGAVCYQPWSTEWNQSFYYAYGIMNYSLYDQTGQADWGYNPISNGGNQENQWRTLTYEEWDYLLNTRNTVSGIRYAMAGVGPMAAGMIILPDDWDASYYGLNAANCVGGCSYESNFISISEWTNSLETHGAVFIPAAGRRIGTNLYNVDYFTVEGYYWTSSQAMAFSDGGAKCVCFGGDWNRILLIGQELMNGFSVRLVRSVE